MKIKKNLNLKISGAAGEGIKSVGLMLSKAFVRAGFYSFDYTEYPSLIRGGHNTYQSYISFQPTFSQIKPVDILLAFNEESVRLHQEELHPESLVIYNADKFNISPKKELRGQYLPIPLQKLATENGGLPIMANNAALGAVMFLTQIDFKILNELIAQTFADKDQAVVAQNQKASQAGYNYAAKNFKDCRFALQKPHVASEKILLSGNEAISLGAISAGMKFFAAYPMTPTTNILHYLAAMAKNYHLVVKHAEDEISAINMAIGVSFTGARSMVATSGGGFCLMTEALGLAGMMELPIVIVEGMRAGPSTGMPTWSDQGDLKFVINASHGEFPRLVLAPGDIEECFSAARRAFYFSQKFQIPVIILIDKYLAESVQSLKPFSSLWTNSGISKRTIPGQPGGVYLTNSYEHDKEGFATEDEKIRRQMVEKRLKKSKALTAEVQEIKQFQTGATQAEIGLISWGSNKGPVLEALKQLPSAKISFLNLSAVWPLPYRQVKDFLQNKTRVIDLECNATGQLASLIREQTGIEIKEKFLKYDGRPFYPEEIVNKLGKLV